MTSYRSKNRRETVTVVVSQKTHEKLGDAAHQLRESQTELASAAIVHYLDFLQKTKQYNPSVPSVDRGLVFARSTKRNG
jgi:hypothetical protein